MTSPEFQIINKFQLDAPVDIKGMAEALGLTVKVSTSLPDGFSGMICRDPSEKNDSGYTITVNAHDSLGRRRFTIAHECAHYLLHRDRIGDGITDDAMYRSSNLTTQEEYDANNKAAELLMPRNLVLKFWDKNPIYTELANRFEVSEAAMRVRLKYLLYLR